MKDIAKLLEEMKAEGVVNTYAIFGAAAQMRYTEAVVTMDLDVLVAVSDSDNDTIVSLSPIYDFCKEKGYYPEGEAIRIGIWPVQFIPAYDNLTKEAMTSAINSELEGITVRVVSADYLAAIALKAGRAKDMARILALLEADAISMEKFDSIIERFGLTDKWAIFRRKFLDEKT